MLYAAILASWYALSPALATAGVTPAIDVRSPLGFVETAVMKRTREEVGQPAATRAGTTFRGTVVARRLVKTATKMLNSFVRGCGKGGEGKRGKTYVEPMVAKKERQAPAAPTAVPISRWSFMEMLDTVEFIISHQPMKYEARKMRMLERTRESGVLVAMPGVVSVWCGLS